MRRSHVALLGSIAARFLRGRRSRLIDGTARSALLGTTIGVAAMVVAMALMTGYREDLQLKLTQGSAAVLVYPLDDSEFENAGEISKELEAIDSVQEVRRVTYGQGALTSRTHPETIDVSLRGVDWTDEIGGLGEVDLLEGLEESKASDVVLGEELVRKLSPAPGEVMRLMVLGVRAGRPRFAYESVRWVGTFRSGFSEFDRRLTVLDRERLEQLAGAGVGESVYELIVSDLSETAAVSRQVEDLLGPNHLVVDWRELNRELFTALRIQQIALFLVLGLIVLVSTFNVASNLVVLVRERIRDVGVLAALGLGPRALRNLFLLYGGVLGAAGLLLGVGLGWLVSWLLTKFELIHFEEELAAIYFISSIPFRVRLIDLAAVAVFTIVITALACYLPARNGGRVRPAVALRYE